MKQKIPVGVFVAVIVIAVVGVLYFGWRTVSGGPNADITQEAINRYQGLKAKALAHKPTSREDAAKAGAPIGGAPIGSAPVGSPGR